MVRCKFKDFEGFREMLLRNGFFTQKDYANHSGISYHTVQTFISGRRLPTFKTALKIAKSLDLTFDDLFVFQHGDS